MARDLHERKWWPKEAIHLNFFQHSFNASLYLFSVVLLTECVYVIGCALYVSKVDPFLSYSLAAA